MPANPKGGFIVTWDATAAGVKSIAWPKDGYKPNMDGGIDKAVLQAADADTPRIE